MPNQGLFGFSSPTRLFSGKLIYEKVFDSPDIADIIDISQEFSHLEIRGHLSAASVGIGGLGIYVNGDTNANNYIWQYHYVYGASHAVGKYASCNCGWVSGTDSGLFSNTIINVLWYNSNHSPKIFSIVDICHNSNGNHIDDYGFTNWYSTAPVTRLTFGAGDGPFSNLAVGSILQVIGISDAQDI